MKWWKKPSLELIHYNKELFSSEVGSWISFYICVIVFSLLITSAKTVTIISIIGSIFAGVLTWFIFRVHHGKKRKDHSHKKLVFDILHIAPAAMIFAILVYHPMTLLITNALIDLEKDIVFSTGIAKASAFIGYLLLMNLFHLIVHQTTGRKL